ncbi:SusD/RagB family nutrient-binding outer membrane lipoprotein [Sphingobacterium daejeonense]|uniref:SusD/RagB family nutrient-binding outer membrane lipoprotein n=1 Tax=Sphingobacterium daejeonense TaxID=371142 RepID=UPI0010C40BA3|nr:SusD/RagB family nutrient-binding outer membrane lipoprotein [Sphingobacterium daejeonense]VTP92472.1 Susd and RagB outer membrane lipoprotein [Sphingobacterium daejeonense]
MKKFIKIGKISILALGLLSLNSCKDYFDLTENPNLVQNPPLNALLTTATHKAAFNNYRIATFNNHYAQYFASPSAGSDTDTYQITNNSTTWNNLFYALADLYDYMVKSEEAAAYHHLGVAQALTAYQLALVSDTWGSVPYSQAFGKEPILTVPYDSEEDLYKEQIVLLNKALENFKKTDGSQTLTEKDDLLNGGDIDKWIRFTNGLKARALNKVSKKSTYNAKEVIAAAQASLESNAEDVGMATFDGVNPWASISRSNLQNVLDGWLSSNFIDQLNGTTYGIEDPRVSKITEKTVHGVYKGTRNGEGNTGAANTVRDECYISYNSPLSNDAAPLTILTYAEVKFIEAEAAFRDNNQALAYTAYQAGIKASMDKLGVPAADATKYITAVSKGQASLTLLDIFREKYVVTYLNSEAWNDVRRFDYKYKDFKLPVGAVLGDKFIRRVAYPAEEITENGSNVPAEVPLSTELWWDKP